MKREEKEMSLEARKKLLVIACTCDRLEAEVRWQRKFGKSNSPLAWAGKVGEMSKLLGAFQPRWMRIGAVLLSLFAPKR
ncbi:MAG: hypothetical protein SynsKO_00680 [Synoicihabitans sp.]